MVPTRIQRLPYTIFDAVVLISMADLSLCLAPEFIACFGSPIVRADSLGATGDPSFPRGPPIRVLSHPRPGRSWTSVSRSVTHLYLHSTWGNLLEALLDLGPQACIDAVRRVERGDLHGRQFPRTAPSNDASAIALRLVV